MNSSVLVPTPSRFDSGWGKNWRIFVQRAVLCELDHSRGLIPAAVDVDSLTGSDGYTVILGLDQAWPEDPQDHCVVQAPRFNAEFAEQNEIAEKILALPQGRGPRPINNFSATSAFSAISALKAGVGSPPPKAGSPRFTPKAAVRLGPSR